MSDDRTPLSARDIKELTTDNDGRLYWKGERVVTTRLTTARLAVIVSAVGVTILGLANLDSIRDNLLGPAKENVPEATPDPSAAAAGAAPRPAPDGDDAGSPPPPPPGPATGQ